MTSTGVTKGRERGNLYPIKGRRKRFRSRIPPSLPSSNAFCMPRRLAIQIIHLQRWIVNNGIYFLLDVRAFQPTCMFKLLVNQMEQTKNKHRVFFFFSDIVLVKSGIHLNAIFLPLNMALMEISRSRLFSLFYPFFKPLKVSFKFTCTPP